MYVVNVNIVSILQTKEFHLFGNIDLSISPTWTFFLFLPDIKTNRLQSLSRPVLFPELTPYTQRND